MITNIRQPLISDLNYILDIDLKCFEDPWDIEVWKEIVKNETSNMFIGTYRAIPVGVIVWTSNILARIGVKPSFRGNGVGTQLIHALELAEMQKGTKTIITFITESLCCPGHKLDVSRWFVTRGYRGKGIAHDKGLFCGMREDEYIFEKILEMETKTYAKANISDGSTLTF